MGFNDDVFVQIGFDLVGYFMIQFLVVYFMVMEVDVDFDFVVFFKEFVYFVQFDLVVVFVCDWMEFYFFDFDLFGFFFGFVGFFLCFEFEFVEVYDFVDWWIGLWLDFDQVQVFIFGYGQCFVV